MIYEPSHVKKYLSKIPENNSFFIEPVYGEFTFGYEVCCSCGKKEFIVSKNSEPKVTAYCESCGETITLYDLAEYPCAVVVEENQDEMKKITNNNNEKFNVAVVYEYSDEIPLDDEEVVTIKSAFFSQEYCLHLFLFLRCGMIGIVADVG